MAKTLSEKVTESHFVVWSVGITNIPHTAIGDSQGNYRCLFWSRIFVLSLMLYSIIFFFPVLKTSVALIMKTSLTKLPWVISQGLQTQMKWNPILAIANLNAQFHNHFIIILTVTNTCNQLLIGIYIYILQFIKDYKLYFFVPL